MVTEVDVVWFCACVMVAGAIELQAAVVDVSEA